MNPDPNEETEIAGDSIKIFVRVRPPAFEKDDNVCINVTSQSSLTLMSKSNPRQFDFDHVADHLTQQETVFASVGKRIVESCVEGYNGTIFAYGQTGSGKTYTMLGTDEENSQNFDDYNRGIIPRCLEYLFQLIERKQYMHGDQFEFMCKVSFLEIYNEQIFDLLDQASTRPLHLRESQSHGVFVAGIIERTASNEAEAYNTLLDGWSNRRVASTSMNRESSRSHAVFSLTVELKQHIAGVTKIRQSVLNLVDLAGSERQTDTHASGLQLREAGNINNSLSVLGQVIMALDDIAHKKQRHIPYRNSKLTFLLRDSLGGNAKTSIIINVHPNSRFFGETLSTLQFAQRAIAIRNRARINENTEGDVVELQNEIRRLKQIINNNNGLSSSLVTDSKLSDSSLEYRNKFFVAMQMREWQHKLLLSYKEQLAKLTKSNSTLGLIIKYRNSYIACLKNGTQVLQNKRNAELEDEIEALKQQVANHPEIAAYVTKVTTLQNEIDRLKFVTSVQGSAKISENHERELEKSYVEILKEMNEEESGLDSARSFTCNSSLLKEGEDKKKFMESEQKVASQEEEISKLKETNTTLEAELKSSKAQILELENVLKAMQAGSAIERKRMNYVHDLTIKTITTPRRRNAGSDLFLTGSTPAKTRKHGDVLFPGNDSSPVADDIFDTSVDVSLLQDVSMPYCPDDEAVQDGLQIELQEARDNIESLRKESCDKDCKIIALQKSECSLKDQLETYKKYFNEEKMKIAQSEKVSSEYRTKLETMDIQLRNLQELLKSSEQDRKQMQNNLDIMQADFSKKNSILEDKFSKLQLNCSNIIAEKEKLLQEYQMTVVDAENLRAEVDFINERHSEAKELLEHERKKCLETEKQLEEAAGKLAFEKETSTMLREQLEGDNLHVSEALASLQSENMDLEKTIQVMREGADSLERELKMCRADLSKASRSKEQNKKTILALMNQVTELRGTVSMQELANSGLHADLDEVNDKLTETSSELDVERKKLEEIAKELSEHKENTKILSSKHSFDMENLQEDLQGWITQHEEMTEEMTNKEELLQNAKREMAALEEKMETLKNETCTRENDLKQHLSSLMSEERRQREADEERKKYEYETLQKNFDEIIGKYNNLRTRAGLLEMELKESKEEHVLAAKNHKKQMAEVQDKLLKEYQEANITEMQELKSAIESAQKNNALSTTKISRLENQLEEAERELGAVREEQCRQNENVKRFKESEDKRFSELQEVRLQLEKEQLLKRQVEKQMAELNGEKENLSQQLAKLAGHNNHHQKIQYLVKIRERCATLEFENSQLKQEKTQLTFELRKFNPNFASRNTPSRPEHSSVGVLSTRNSNK